MYTNLYYTSYVLTQELVKLKCNITGTILTNRKELPKEIKKSNFSKKNITRDGVEIMVKKFNIVLNYIKYKIGKKWISFSPI